MPTDPGAGPSFSIDTDTSGVKAGVDPEKAGGQASREAVGSAQQVLDMLGGFAKGVASGGEHKGISAFTMDRNGKILSQASLDADGDLMVYGSGGSRGATSEISMYLPSDGGSGQDWYKQVSSEMALASYTLNSVMGKAGSNAQGTRVSAMA